MSENFSAYMAEAIAKAEQRGAERVANELKERLFKIVQQKKAIAAGQRGLELELHVENIIGNIYADFGQEVYDVLQKLQEPKS